MWARRFRSLAAAAALGVVVCGADPARAASSVTVRVEFYYGAAVAGGMGFFVYIAGAWEAWAGREFPATALLEIERGRVRGGIPLPVSGWSADEGDGRPDGVRVDLVRVRF